VRVGTFAVAAAGALLLTTVRGASGAAAEGAGASNALARELLAQLVAINTTDTPRGNVTTAAEAMAQRLRTAGFAADDIQVLGPSERKKNLVVRLRGTGRHEPLLLIGHLDVVEARREDWSTDPFALVEKEGQLYGRGTLDMKGPDAIMLAALIRLKQEQFTPARDIILALTADEEGGGANGVQWLLQHHRELVAAQFVLSGDDYSVLTENGRPLFFKLVASEKVYADFQLLVTNKGGHSSVPVSENAIYTLTRGLDRLAAYQFPFELNAVTREYYRRLAQIESGQRAADMRAILRDPPEEQALARLSQDPPTARSRTPPVSRRASTPDMPTTRCHSGRSRWSIAASCPDTRRRRCGSAWCRCWQIPASRSAISRAMARCVIRHPRTAVLCRRRSPRR